MRLFAILNLLFSILTFLGAGCKSSDHTVVVYASQDQVYAEPILRRFEAQTGIHVRPVYDSEAVKTVGLVNRLIAERNNPRCDVFWNNEEFRTRQLQAKNILRKTNAWAAIGYRSRRIVINTNILAAPKSFVELTNSVWKGKLALAYPLFGTTATHFLALRQAWGAEAWERWCRALKANAPLLVDGNSVVVQMVSRGEAMIGLTDSDDIAAGQTQNMPVTALPLTTESLLIPNTVSVIRNSPHPSEAQRLFEFLQSPEVLDELIKAHALEGKDPHQSGSQTLTVDWASLLRDVDVATDMLKTIFLQ
jgi:iron(III) transport system substrate-binding protein